jgi:TetR/AcrR family transcriptional regulator
MVKATNTRRRASATATTDEPDEATDERPAPVGRPRANPRPLAGSARDEVVRAAARLFAERGYAATTMAEIAEGAGLRQSSLYYYFGRKELILEAAFGLTRAPAELIRQLRRDTPGLALFRLLHRDATQLCLTPCDVNEVWRVARVEAELFAEFWEDRRELHRRVEGFVSKGAGDGSFHEVDARLTALNLVAANEGAQNWWRQRDLNRLDGRAAGRPSRFTPEELADQLASAALRGLLRRPAQLTAIRRDAAKLDGGEHLALTS